MESRPTKKGLTAIDGALTLLGILLIVQMWLLTATLESYLAGHHAVALPGLLSSTVLFAVCVFFYWLVLRIDRMAERSDQVPRSAAGPWRIGGNPR